MASLISRILRRGARLCPHPQLVRDLAALRLRPEFAAALFRRYGVERAALRMSLFVTSCCQRMCGECIMRGLMEACPGYHMGLDEVQMLLEAAQQSGYRFEFILTGGEPALWKHLGEGARQLKSSPVCSKLTIFTNAVNPALITDEAAFWFDEVRISGYAGNGEQSRLLKTRFGSKVVCVDRQEFWAIPAEPMTGVLPAACLNDEFFFFNGQVYSCPHALALAGGSPAGALLSVPVRPRFLRGLDGVKIKQQSSVCATCISNGRVRERVVKVGSAPRGAACGAVQQSPEGEA